MGCDLSPTTSRTSDCLILSMKFISSLSLVSLVSLKKKGGGRPDGLNNLFHLFITVILTAYAYLFSLNS